MKLHHIAIWTKSLETMRKFYQKYFDMDCGEIYQNPQKGFSSYFLNFGNSKTRIELMYNKEMAAFVGDKGKIQGLAHLAVSVGSKENVNKLTERLQNDGFIIDGEARTTGDGYYESVILDPEGNYIEITI